MNDIDEACIENSAWQVRKPFTPKTSDQIRCPGCDGTNNDPQFIFDGIQDLRQEYTVFQCLDCGQRFTERTK